MIIHLAAEVIVAVKPWAGPDEDAVGEPVRAIVAVGSAGVGSVVVVAVGAIGGDSNVDAYLSPRFRSGPMKQIPATAVSARYFNLFINYPSVVAGRFGAAHAFIQGRDLTHSVSRR